MLNRLSTDEIPTENRAYSFLYDCMRLILTLITDLFENFETKVLEYKMVTVMTGNLGRKRRMSVMAVTGNRGGLAGFAMGKAIDPKSALRVARNRAGQKLIFFDRFNDHTGRCMCFQSFRLYSNNLNKSFDAS